MSSGSVHQVRLPDLGIEYCRALLRGGDSEWHVDSEKETPRLLQA